jgi:hypothetical protein
MCAAAAYVRQTVKCERGQASVEWVGLVLLVATGLAAVLVFVPLVDGRSHGGALAHAIVCAVRGGCAAADGDRALARAYGLRDAALVRRYAPNIAYEPGTYTLPVDWRRCRSHLCSDAADASNLDAHMSTRTGTPATAFTHVVHRGGETFIQYWFYYPDSTTTWGGAAALWGLLDTVDHSTYPGFHKDDWEDASGTGSLRPWRWSLDSPRMLGSPSRVHHGAPTRCVGGEGTSNPRKRGASSRREGPVTGVARGG